GANVHVELANRRLSGIDGGERDALLLQRLVTLDKGAVDLGGEFARAFGEVEQIGERRELGQRRRNRGLALAQILVDLHRVDGPGQAVHAERQSADVELAQVGGQFAIVRLSEQNCVWKRFQGGNIR